MNLDLSSKIGTKLARFADAKQALIDTATAQQQACKHELCWLLPWRSYEYAGCSSARRICVKCRYEEEGSHWSGADTWSRPDFSTPILGKSIVVKTLSSDEFFSKRLPVDVPDWHPASIKKRAQLERELAERRAAELARFDTIL